MTKNEAGSSLAAILQDACRRGTLLRAVVAPWLDRIVLTATEQVVLIVGTDNGRVGDKPDRLLRMPAHA